MATSLLTKYQNRRKTGQLGQQYRGSVQRYGIAKQRYDTGASAYASAKTAAAQTQSAMENWSQNFWQNTEQGKGLQSVLSRYSGLGINVDAGMDQQALRSVVGDTVYAKTKTGKDLTLGQGLGTLNALQKEYDHSLTRTYSGTRKKDLSWWERMTTDPINWYESYDTTAEERQKRKDALTGFKGTTISGLDFTWGDLSSDLSNWGTIKSGKTYLDYQSGLKTRTAADARADANVASLKEQQQRYGSEYSLAKSSMARMQSMYHGARQRDARRSTSRGGTQKKSSILLGYA
tara:strand:+ start:293 stop:1162 length:870 start_codon:yes stop_codon:yes gene_type:complete